MRILLTVIDAHLVGGQRVALAMARRLRADGNELLAVFPGEGPLHEGFARLGVRSTGIPSWRIRNPRVFWDLYVVAHSFRPDLVYSHCSTGGEFISTVVARAARVPIVIHRHSGPDFGVGRAHQWLARLLSRWAYSAAAKVIAVSAATRDAVLRTGTGAEKVALIMNGVSTEKFLGTSTGRARLRAEWGAADNACVTVLVGRLCEQKGQSLLIEAAHCLPCRDLCLRFVFVGADQEGRGAYEAHLRRLAAAYGLGDCVTFAGHREDLADIYAASDIAVLPSRVDWCPIAILEAMAAGRPVVATDTTGACEIVEDEESGLIVPIGRADLLAVAITRLAEDRSLRERLAAGGLARVREHFGENTFFGRVSSVLRKARRS